MIDAHATGVPVVHTSRVGTRRHAGRRRGFTLIELLVVITIVLLVSAVTLPTILPALSHRQVSEAARMLQAALAGARDAAIRDNAPSGIRLLPDPVFSGLNAGGVLNNTIPLAYNRVIPIAIPPQYQEGQVSTFPLRDYLTFSPAIFFPSAPGVFLQPTKVLVLEETPGTWQLPPGGTYTYVLNSPTSWFWNIRVGDKVQINNAGVGYTVIGPLKVNPANPNTLGQNPELFVNVGNPGDPNPLNYPNLDPNGVQHGNINPEYLLLVNGQDDNANGWVDEEWDGVDNNLAAEIANNLPHLTDDSLEWIEDEKWLGALATAGVTNANYSIQRRPTPTTSARETALPSNVVIDATTWGASAGWGGQPERTRVPASALNVYSGVIDILVNPDGSVVPTTIYSSPSSFGMDASFCHFWLAERSDVYAIPAQTASGSFQSLMASVGVTGNPPYPFYLPMPLSSNLATSSNGTASYDALVASNPTVPYLKGEMRIVTLFTRTGQITTNDNPVFDVLNVSQPFAEAQQGISGVQK
jgi:prepilin-type N-terminal cleavage/methylation domain-containing protein